MNIVHFSENPLSSAPYRLMKVQREFWDSRLIMHKDSFSSYSGMKYPYDILLQKDKFNREEVVEILEDADVFHFHNFLQNHYIFKLIPEIKNMLKDKKVIYQVHSPRTTIPDFTKIVRNPYLHKKLVLAQFHARQYPEFEVVPNVVPIMDPLHVPINRPMDKIRICFSPSNTKLKGWNNKGYKEVMRAIRDLRGEFEFILIENTPHEECLRIKQTCHICIDEVMTGSYHMSSLEAMAQGLVVINNIDEKCEDALSRYTGTKEHPMRKANSLSLLPVLQELIDNPNMIKFHMGASRNFMEKYWSTERILDWFEEVYK